MLVEGIRIESRRRRNKNFSTLDGKRDVELNDWLAVNQVTVYHDRNHRIPDILTQWLANNRHRTEKFRQRKSYFAKCIQATSNLQKEIPLLFQTNQILVSSNGVHSRFGSLTAGWDRYMPWRAMDFEFETEMELEFMIYQMFNKEMLIEYIHDFILFQSKQEGDIKIAAGYHQYHAVKATIEEPLRK